MSASEWRHPRFIFRLFYGAAGAQQEETEGQGNKADTKAIKSMLTGLPRIPVRLPWGLAAVFSPAGLWQRKRTHTQVRFPSSRLPKRVADSMLSATRCFPVNVVSCLKLLTAVQAPRQRPVTVGGSRLNQGLADTPNPWPELDLQEIYGKACTPHLSLLVFIGC